MRGNELYRDSVTVAKNDEVVHPARHAKGIHDDIDGAYETGGRYRGGELDAKGDTGVLDDDAEGMKLYGRLKKRRLP